jgi:polar amino acid transport system permease protein
VSLSSQDFLGYLEQMAHGALITAELFAAGFGSALLFGFLIGIVSLAPNRLIQAVWRIYASAMMGVPSLVVLFIIYYGGDAVLTATLGGRRAIDITPFMGGVITLAAVYAAYIAELLRGAFINLPKGQSEACSALGIGTFDAWRYVILPQLIRLAFPGLVNIWLIVLKDTPLVSLAGLHDLVAMSKIAAGSTKSPFIFFVAAALFFIGFSALTSWLARRIEIRLDRGLRRA